MGCAGHSIGTDQANLRRQWGDCISTAVTRLDDRKTDPISMAYGVVPICHSIYNDLIEAMVYGYLTDSGRANMRAEMRSGEVKLATSAVLAHRNPQH